MGSQQAGGEVGGLAASFAKLAESAQIDPVRSEPTRRFNRQQQQAEVAERPFVKKALEVFGIEPGQYRYTPPDSDP